MAVVPKFCPIERLYWSCLGLLWVGSGPERQRLTALPTSCSFCQGNSMLWFIFLCLYVVTWVINACKNLLLKAISKIVNWWIKSMEVTLLCYALGLCNIVSSTLNQSINLPCFNKPHNDSSITVLLSLSITLSTFLHLATDILLLKNNGTFVSCQNPTWKIWQVSRLAYLSCVWVRAWWYISLIISACRRHKCAYFYEFWIRLIYTRIPRQAKAI